MIILNFALDEQPGLTILAQYYWLWVSNSPPKSDLNTYSEQIAWGHIVTQSLTTVAT